MRIKNNTLDIFASLSSFICAVHCVVAPIIVSFSSLGSLSFLENPYIEWTFIGIGVVFVIISLWPSYRKVHHQTKPLFYAALGFTIIAIGRLEFTELWEISNTVIGALLVSTAHYFNWKILKNSSN